GEGFRRSDGTRKTVRHRNDQFRSIDMTKAFYLPFCSAMRTYSGLVLVMVEWSSISARFSRIRTPKNPQPVEYLRLRDRRSGRSKSDRCTSSTLASSILSEECQRPTLLQRTTTDY